jgi:hypothetical protein
MAFTYCKDCGEKIDIDDITCPHCGKPQHTGGYTYTDEKYGNTSGDGRKEQSFNGGYNQYGQGQYGQGQYGQGQYGQGQYQGQGRYNPYSQGRGFNPLYRTPMRPVKRPISKGLLAFSIINIVLSFFLLPSLIFGIIALIFTVQAQSAPSAKEEINKKKIALILNIVGLVLSIITVISSLALLAEALAQILANNGNI